MEDQLGVPPEGLPEQASHAAKRSLRAGKNKFRRRLVCVAVCAVIAVIGGVFIYLATRVNGPSNAEFGTETYSPPSLVSAGFFDGATISGRVQLDVLVPLDAGDSVLYRVSVVSRRTDDVPTNTTLVLFSSTDDANFFELDVVINANTPIPADIALQALGGRLIFKTGDDLKVIEFSLDIQGSDVVLPTTKRRSFLSSPGGYTVEGVVTLTARAGLDSRERQAMLIPYLQFENIFAPSAPGPFFYLSPNPSERNQRLDGQSDVFVPIAGVVGGEYIKDGNFSQDIGNIISASEIDNFQSIVVWCRPFRVYLGGGEFELVNA